MYELLFGRRRRKSGSKKRKGGKNVIKVGKAPSGKQIYKNKTTGRKYTRGKGGRKTTVKFGRKRRGSKRSSRRRRRGSKRSSRRTRSKFGRKHSRRSMFRRRSRRGRKRSSRRRRSSRRMRRFSRFGGSGRPSTLLQMEGPYGAM